MNRPRNPKILTLRKLSRIIEREKKQGKEIVFTNGCFDLLHIGHVRLFRKAKASGDILIVAINSDKSVRRIKGPKRPIVPALQRMEVLSSIDCVDYVMQFGQDTPLKVIKLLLPHVIVKGADWKQGAVVGEGYARVIRAPYIKGFSSSALIQKIIDCGTGDKTPGRTTG